MKLSAETLESFVNDRNAANEFVASEVANSTQAQRIEDQILRAAHIARHGGGRGSIGKGVITYGTYWANIAYDANKDILTQARLHGKYERRNRFFAGAPINVQLYLRASGLDAPIHSHKQEYAALFSCWNLNEIKVPVKGGEPFPEQSRIVLPDTNKWRQLDYTLGQIAAKYGS